MFYYIIYMISFSCAEMMLYLNMCWISRLRSHHHRLLFWCACVFACVFHSGWKWTAGENRARLHSSGTTWDPGRERTAEPASERQTVSSGSSHEFRIARVTGRLRMSRRSVHKNATRSLCSCAARCSWLSWKNGDVLPSMCSAWTFIDADSVDGWTAPAVV